jgi:hypothetical protein
MTCREFKHMAASLTLWELSRTSDGQILDHADECSRCGAWLERQQMLAAAMQPLHARTAGREAGPHVERALLRMFRQVPFEAPHPVAAHRSTPIALRLSHFFEIGAYVAVAAAIVVGLFLGVRLLEERSIRGPAQGRSAPASTPPLQQNTASVQNITGKKIGPATHERLALSPQRELAVRRVSQGGSATHSSAAAASQSGDDPGYVALMFCDPLSCSSDAQVVRMELTSDRDAQPQVADVVVGYDGVVRAVRIVN